MSLILDAFDHALSRLERTDYTNDPISWAWDRLGVRLWSRQRDIAMSVCHNRRTAVRSSHGAGKSFLAAVLACWWIDTHPPGTAMVISTAPSYDQVHGVLWENIRELHAKGSLPGEVQRSDRWLDDQGKLVGFGRRPPDHADSAFQGYHRRYVLVILDEAGGIPAWLWTAAEALTTGEDCRVIAIGNPTDNASHFARLRSMGTWATSKISTFETPNFTGEIDELPEDMRYVLPSRTWQEDALTQWGEKSALYQVRVLGEFADSDDGLIPLSWVAQANLRWHAWKDAGGQEVGGRRIFGCDPAWLGEDHTAIAMREGDVIREIRRYSKMDTTQTAEILMKALLFPKSVSVVDVIGIGAGVVDVLRANHQNVIAFNASKPTKHRDSSGQWGFPNLRSASWYNMRELLDPALKATLALPEDDLLAGDLTTPHYGPATGAKILVETKDEIRKRLNRSPDTADAVALSLWHNPTTGRSPEGEGYENLPRKQTRPGAVRYQDSIVW